jgi:hypothetical protein
MPDEQIDRAGVDADRPEKYIALADRASAPDVLALPSRGEPAQPLPGMA